MSKYIALLRGVNVGGRVIKMAELKVCLEKSGLKNIETVLQSGNVVFESESNENELKEKVETILTETFSYPAKAQVLHAENLQEIISAYPFGRGSDTQHDYIIFIENGLEKQLIAEPYSLGEGESVKVGVGTIYWRVNKGSTLKSNFAKILTNSKYKTFHTNRNIKTLIKIANL